MAMDDAAETLEDETDLAIKHARKYAPEAVEMLILAMHDKDATLEDRVRAATTLLEVAGCL